MMSRKTKENGAETHTAVENFDLIGIGEIQRQTSTSRRFVELQIKSGALHAIRISPRMIRVRRSELERWVASFEAAHNADAGTNNPERAVGEVGTAVGLQSHENPVSHEN